MNAQDDYYERQAERSERAAALIILLWVFFSGAVAGYVLAGVMG